MNKNTKTLLFTCCYFIGIISVLLNFKIQFSICIFLFLILLIVFKKLSAKTAVIFMLIFLTGLLNCLLRFKDFDDISVIAPKNDITTVGTVVSLPSSSSNDYTKFTLNAEKYIVGKSIKTNVSAKIAVTVFADKKVYQNIEIGDKISLKGRLTTPKSASNPSEFCYSSFLKYKNIHSCLYVMSGDFSIISKPIKPFYKFLNRLNRLRNKIIALHAKYIHSPQLELLGGIVFGDDAVNPSPEMKISFQNSGLTHIIAASGMNVSMIFGMWFFISRIFKFNYIFSLAAGMCLIICYTCMTGFGAPVLRASLMLLFIIFGKMINRSANSASLLFIVAFLMLLISPTMIMNIGFQLSFLVTLGLLLFCPIILTPVKNKFLSPVLSFVTVPVIAQFFAAPLQMYYFNSFSTYSFFANISVVPILSIISSLGFVSSVFAIFKPVSEIFVKYFDYVLYPFLSFITSVSDFFSNLPCSTIKVSSPSICTIILFYSLLFSLYFLIKTKNYKKIFSMVFVILLAGFILSCIKIPNNKNEIIFFSVDNADAIFIKTSKNKNILIDTGKAPYKNFSTSAEKVILKYFTDKNIKDLDALILSHYDSDHVGGALFIMDKVKIKKLFVRHKEKNSNLSEQILNKAEELNIEIKIPEYNETIFDDNENRITAIYSEKGDDNDTSVISLFETPECKVLFTGDSGKNSFEKLKGTVPKNIDVLKIAHHGSKDSLSEEYLRHINPKYAVISTGFNIYGHPDKETLNLLKSFKIPYYRTDINNAIKVVIYKNKILLYSYNTKRKKFERIKDD